MDSDKKNIVQCDCQDEESGVRDCGEQQRVERDRKRRGSCLLTSLFLFLLAVIGLTTIAVTAKLFLDVADTKFNVQLPSSGSSDDVTASDAEQKAVKDHVIEQVKHQIVSTFTDYDKRLEVLKAQNELNGVVICYVTPLMGGRLDDDKRRNTIPNIGTPDIMTSDATTTDSTTPATPTRRTWHFVASVSPINDVTFLGEKVGGMCAGVETYWMISTVPADELVQQDTDNRIIITHSALLGGFNDVTGRMRREALPWRQQLQQPAPQLKLEVPPASHMSAGFRMLDTYDRPPRPRQPSRG